MGTQLISQERRTDGSSSTWTASFYGHDGLGSTRALYGSTGSATDTYTYDALGKKVDFQPTTGSTVNNYLFAGEQWDPDLKLYYNRARYLNVDSGRFTSRDTLDTGIGDVGNLHRYLYVSGDPINRIDPSGKIEFTIGGLTSVLGIDETIQALKAGPETAINQRVRTFGRNLAESLSFEDKNPNEAREIAAERFWALRLQSLGLMTINLSASIRRHGPDLVAFGCIGGKHRIIIGEVEGMTRGRILSALDRVEDNSIQMSAAWLDRGLSTVANGLLAMVEASIGVNGIGAGPVEDSLRRMMRQGELDLYLLRARDMRNGTWQLSGFRLMHIGGDPNEVERGADGSIPEIESVKTVQY
jgi:RHS repeat-associated protein